MFRVGILLRPAAAARPAELEVLVLNGSRSTLLATGTKTIHRPLEPPDTRGWSLVHMRYHWLYALSFLTATPLANSTTPLATWDDMRLIGRLWAARPPEPLSTHLSKEQVAELPSSISTTHGGAWLTVSNVLVSQANEMLGASYQLYRHAKLNDTIIRTVSYALPEVLHAHIQAVAPTTYFASTRTLRQTSRRRSVEAAAALAEAEAASGKPVTVLSSRDYEITPLQLRGLYKTFAYIHTVADRNTLGVFGYHKGYLSETDLTMYMTNFRSDVQPPSLTTFTIELVNGGRHPADHQHIIRHLWAVPQEYTTALCTLFAQLGARGVSVLFPSGDSGVGENCEDKSGIVRFISEFPASCPYLTTVGGTTYYDPEVAAPLSGGGFSDYFPRPRYQDVAVSAFLERQGTQLSPDGTVSYFVVCAAQAVMASLTSLPKLSELKFSFFLGNVGVTVDGTSCSTPAPLGFLNIRLYDDGLAGLNDITSGSNPGCGTDGFSAVPGWDPVTGLGTPDFEKLQNIFMIPLGGSTGQGNQPKIRRHAE
ncbi:peptidase S8/S53 domain-containing protein [Lactarius akahatsu]|uniref:Peptidase S8/S53 domain-containing protein n=1 Tax=Lactarius akahatsu TaxID=416441 RepID=A0AAD4Q3S2_9AGAM|nr:peptidase S8/S53 domain-containing protein [Lactarius akahatsu]